MESKTFSVEGLSCSDCAARIQASVKQMDAVDACEVDVNTGLLTVWLESPEALDESAVSEMVAATGHRLLSGRRHTEQGSVLRAFWRFLQAYPETKMLVLAAQLTLVGLLASFFHVGALAWGCFAMAIIVGGGPVARHAAQELLRARTLGINALMVIAVVGAMAIGEWAEAAIVVVLFSLGEALERYAAERARGALEGLLDLVPPVALRLSANGESEEVPVEQLLPGDMVLVRPGDRVSVDGVVRAGESAIDQAAITGESVPVDKAPGDPVFAGTVNTFAALHVEVTRLAQDNTLNRMIELVQEAQSRQAPVQRFVDRFARVYTPVVTALALLIAVLPPLLLGQPFWGTTGWLMRALQMLVIACPCALVISTPVSVVSALTNAAARGVLVKGGRTLETLGRVDVFAFDKTGTLTEGRPVTTDVLDVCAVGDCCGNGLQYAASVEAQSSHPLAKALLLEAQAQKIAVLPAQDVSILQGRGMTGRIDGAQVTVASHPYFDTAIPHSEAVCHEANRLADEGKTVMLVCHDSEVCSIFAVADTPRSESRAVLDALRDLGKLHTVMLTGDNLAVATRVGADVGIDEVHAGLLPQDKVSALEALSAGGRVVAMVGDGVNDAPALATAAVGIAMGGAGSDQAMETADVVLMGDDLRQLPFLVQLSRRMRRVVRANIVFALAIKVLVFAVAAAGWGSLWMAIVADVGASLAVILNGMRLRKV